MKRFIEGITLGAALLLLAAAGSILCGVARLSLAAALCMEINAWEGDGTDEER